jgi:hypothetical protein
MNDLEAMAKSVEPAKPKGFKYSDGSVLIINERGYRRHTSKPLSKRDRAKIKRQAKKQPLAPAAVRSRAGTFFA